MTSAANRLRRMLPAFLRAIVLAAGLAAGTAAAQTDATPPPAGTPPAATEARPIWFKLCETPANICYLQADLVYEGTLVGSLRIDHSGLQQPLLRMLWPLGVLLRPNFAYAVDPGNGTPPGLTTGQFVYCGPLPGNVVGCLGEGPVSASFVEQLRAGARLLLVAFDRLAQEVTLEVSLAGFAAAYDGPAAQTIATGAAP